MSTNLKLGRSRRSECIDDFALGHYGLSLSTNATIPPIISRLQVDMVGWIGRFPLATSSDDVLSGNRQEIELSDVPRIGGRGWWCHT
jgi:hypothetical protein